MKDGKNTRAQEHKSIRTQEHKSIRAQEHKSIRTQEHKSIRAQEHKSIRAQEHKSIRAKEHKGIRAKEHKGIRAKEHKSIRAKEHKSIRVQEHKKLMPYALMTCALIFTGCAKQQQYATIDQISTSNIDKAEAMQIAEDVLVKMHFNIEKADYESGIIRTRPLPGAQFFEFWRSDNVGAFNTAEANLHSIRRIVELHVSQKTEDRKQKPALPVPSKIEGSKVEGTEVADPQRRDKNLTSDTYPLTSVLCIDCDVKVQRLNLPVSRESDKGLSRQNLNMLTRIADATWVDLNKDTKLATKILKRIEKQIRNSKSETK
jgi:hypothetical protein